MVRISVGTTGTNGKFCHSEGEIRPLRQNPLAWGTDALDPSTAAGRPGRTPRAGTGGARYHA